MNPMNNLLQLINISFAFFGQALFRELNLKINKSDKIGLVGHNGCGKSTLFALINQKLALDKGEIIKPHSVAIATVEQFVARSLMSMSLVDAICEALPAQDPVSIQWRAQAILLELGFSDQQFDITVSSLSGGQQNLMLLARAFIQDPDLLLLDEPGNHMDIQAMSKLQYFLKFKCRCAFMIISHDQYLLNEVCSKTVFLRNLQCQKFELPFDAAKLKLQAQDEQSQQRLRAEQKEIDRLKNSAKRLAILGRENDNEKLSKKAKSIEKNILKLDVQKTQLVAQSPLNLQMKASMQSALNAKQLMCIDKHSVNIPNSDRPLLFINNLIIKPKDRIALLGINGVGKSSTLDCLRNAYKQQFSMNKESTKSAVIPSEITYNPRVTLGYYDQKLQLLDSEQTRIDWLREHSKGTEDEIKNALIKAGISYVEFERLVNTLSGGEKARMMFLTFTLNQPNFLVLDEPTNHIDLQGKVHLAEQLEESGATLFITSHDRYFLQRIATRWLLIKDGSLVELNNSDIFYDQLLKSENDTVKPDNQTSSKQIILATHKSTIDEGEEQLLERIEILEKKLALEKAQNVKRQKPARQHALQQELTKLWNLV
jgi:ATPase subunit of ABC transporter with duplicated ATPase domains